MVVYGAHVRREHGLRIVIHRHGGIRPPQEGLGQAGAVVKPGFDLDICFVRVQREGHFPFGAVHLIHFGQFHGHAAVFMLNRAEINRRESGGPVVLGPVELDAAADPGSGQAYQGRFDDLVEVHKIIAVGLVISPLDAPAQLGQHHDPDIVVLQPYGGIRLVLFFVQDFIDHRQRVHLSAAALVHPLFQEHGVFIRLADAVSGDQDGFNLDACVHCSASVQFLNLRSVYCSGTD